MEWPLKREEHPVVTVSDPAKDNTLGPWLARNVPGSIVSQMVIKWEINYSADTEGGNAMVTTSTQWVQ